MREFFFGFRNWSLGVLFILLCAYLGRIAGAEHITEMGGTFGGAAVGIIGVVGMRAANKYAERNRG
jgi:hypothetical protein